MRRGGGLSPFSRRCVPVPRPSAHELEAHAGSSYFPFRFSFANSPSPKCTPPPPPAPTLSCPPCRFPLVARRPCRVLPSSRVDLSHRPLATCPPCRVASPPRHIVP